MGYYSNSELKLEESCELSNAAPDSRVPGSHFLPLLLSEHATTVSYEAHGVCARLPLELGANYS